MDNSFRRLPVDSYSEDIILPTDLYTPDPRTPSKMLEDTLQKQREIKSYLQRGSIGEALDLVLKDYPFGEDGVVGDSKAVALSSILSILNSTKSTDITPLLLNLNPTDQVTLMKYLYKAMENLGDTSGNVILGWHEKLVEIAGTGCITRVMTDRRRV